MNPELRQALDEEQQNLTINLDHVSRSRIRYGLEPEFDGFPTCPDCGCRVGEIHLMGCDQERCPVHPDRQLGTCGCRCTEPDEDDDDDD